MKSNMPRRVILKDEATGKYVGKLGTWFLGEKAHAKVFDWELDDVPGSIEEVRKLYGAIWTPEDAPASCEANACLDRLAGILE